MENIYAAARLSYSPKRQGDFVMTMDEMARQLGVSKSTVSRALSGKGRIGQDTRTRILELAREQGLETAKHKSGGRVKTRNLGVVFPADVYENVNPFFQDCLLGICEAAALMGFQVMITTNTSSDISGIRTLVENRKVDGIILTRSFEDDKAVEYLTGLGFPTAITGQCGTGGVLQVDTDNEGAAEALTTLLVSKGFRRFALVVEDLSYLANRARYEGFRRAMLKNGIPADSQFYYNGNWKKEFLSTVVSDMIMKKVGCVVCGDDVICTRLMSMMQAEGYRIPLDIAIASIYNSPNLNCFSPAVTAVDVNARLMGNTVGRQLIHFLEGKPYSEKTMIDYEIQLRKSTEHVNGG